MKGKKTVKKPIDLDLLIFLVEEAVKSRNLNQGYRCGLYLEAAHSVMNGESSIALDVCMDTYNEQNEK